MKKITFFFFFLCATIVVSCSDNDKEMVANAELELQNACTADDPLELDWIQELISGLNCGEYACEVAILKSQYEGESVFYIKMTDPLCYGFEKIDLYNCYGEKVKEFTLEESREFVNNPGHEAEPIFSCNV